MNKKLESVRHAYDRNKSLFNSEYCKNQSIYEIFSRKTRFLR